MAKLLASSQITIVDLNDAVSLRSYVQCSHARIQFLNNHGTYVPNYVTEPIILTAQLNKLGDNTDIIKNPGTVLSRVDWFVKLAPSQEYVKIIPSMTQYELVGVSPFFSGLKVKQNIMSKTNPGVTFKVEMDYKEPWMQDVHTQISEIDFSLSMQGEDGTDSYTPILTNSNHTIICNANGSVADGEIGVSGRALSDTMAYKGTALLSAVADNPSTGQYSISLQATNCTAIKKNNSSFYINTVTDAKTAKVKVTFNFEGNVNMVQEMSVSKVFNGANGSNGANGADGESAKYITLSVREGTTVFKYEKGQTTPNITKTIIEALKFNVPTATYKWSYYANNSWNVISEQTASTLTVNATDSYFDISNSITFRCTVNNTLTDEITISKLIDGNDSILVQLSNESHVISCYNGGGFKPGEADRAITEVVAYKGAQALSLVTTTPGKGQYKIDVVKNSAVTTTVSNNTIKVTNMTADSAVLVINVNCEGTVFKKTMSLSKAKDGREGIDGYVASLTNEFHSLPANSNGTVTSYTGCVTSIELYRGGDIVTEGITYEALASSGVTGNLIGNTYTVTGLTIDTSSVVLKANYNGKVYSKVFTITKNKQGVNGQHSTSYWLIPSTTSINKSNSGVLSPVSITYNAKSQTGTQAMIDFAGRFKIYTSTNKGQSYTLKYTSSANESSKSYSLPADTTAIKCELYLADGTTMVDTQTIIVVTDGIDGHDGQDAAYVTVSGENTFRYASNFIGTPSPASILLSRNLFNTIGGKWQYYNDVTWTDFSPAQTGATLEVTPTMGHFATSSNKLMKVRYYVNDSIYDEMSIIKIADGADAYTVVLTNPSHTVTANSSGTVSNLSTATTDIVVYRGASTIVPTINNKVVVPSTAEFSIAQGSGNTPSKITMTNFPANVDMATCTVDVVVGDQTFKQTFTVTKAKQGIQGNSSKAVFVSGKQVFKYAKGSAVPAEGNSITLTAVERNFTGSARKWYQDGTVISGQTTPNLVVAHDASYWGNKNTITFKYEADGIYDEITISKLYDGTDTYSVILTNESHSISCNKDGTPLAGELEKASTKVKVFRGSTELTASNTAAANKFKITTGTATGSTAAYVVEGGVNTGVKVASITAESGSIAISVNIDNGKATIEKLFTFNKVKPGADGVAAKVIQISGASSIVYKKDGTYDPAGGIVLTAQKKNTNGSIV